MKGFDFDAATLAEPWREVLLNQFHDILPGSSIHRVYEEAEAGLARVAGEASGLARRAAAALTYRGAGFTVFNSLSWPRYVILETPAGTTEVTVPACGWYSTSGVGDLKGSLDPARTVSLAREGETFILENALLRVVISARGELVSVWDKEALREWLAAPANVLHMYKDVPDIWDAWDLNSMTELPELEVALDEPAAIEIPTNRPAHGFAAPDPQPAPLHPGAGDHPEARQPAAGISHHGGLAGEPQAAQG